MIKRFIPFISIEENSNFTFLCKCGSDSCIKIGELDKFVFWSGFYMCLKCGLSVVNGKQLNYYHDCFIRHYRNDVVELSLF